MFQDPLFIVSANLCVAVLTRIFKRNLLTALLLVIVMIVSTGYLGTRYGSEILGTMYRGQDAVLTMLGRPPSWPPKIDRTFPDLNLIDQEGKPTRLSEFRGRVILVQPVGMPSRTCVAFSGGAQLGPFDGVWPQEHLDFIGDYLESFARVRWDDSRFVFVQVVLFNGQLAAPSPEDVRRWAQHFALLRSENAVVLAGTPDMATPESRRMIPGFFLIDRNFVLRADATGQEPRDDLYRDLLPMLGRLINE